MPQRRCISSENFWRSQKNSYVPRFWGTYVHIGWGVGVKLLVFAAMIPDKIFYQDEGGKWAVIGKNKSSVKGEHIKTPFCCDATELKKWIRTPFEVRIFLLWWRWRDLHPCTNARLFDFLRAQSVFSVAVTRKQTNLQLPAPKKFSNRDVSA